MRIAPLGAISLTLLSGCGVQQVIWDKYTSRIQSIKGEYYLDNKRYRDGMKAFENEAQTNLQSAEAQYYMGRFQLADGHNKKALPYLERAVNLAPESAAYHFWLGVAYAANKKSDAERKSYIKAIELDKDHVQALTYLGHNLLENGAYERALMTYHRAIELWPENTSALYGRALVLKRLKRTPEERLAWKQYLRIRPSGAMARQAALNLNALGDFEYRNQLVGKRVVSLERIAFEPSTALIRNSSKSTLDILGGLLTSDTGLALHIVTYQKNNAALAEARAKSIKRYLVKWYDQIGSSRLKVSWFGVSEKIKIGEKTLLADESVRFITARQQSSKERAVTEESVIERESASLLSQAQVVAAEEYAEAVAQEPDLHAEATLEFLEMAEAGLQDAENSGDKEAVKRAQAAHDAALRSAEQNVAEALSVPMETIQTMHQEDMSWGEIAHELGVHPGVLGLVQKKRGTPSPRTLYMGSGKEIKLRTEIIIATSRNPKSGL